MDRNTLILQILDLNKRFIQAWNARKHSLQINFDLHLTRDSFEMKPDRFYLVESLQEDKGCDYDHKTFHPEVAVHYKLRSGEAMKYGEKHSAYHKRYLSTTSFSYEALQNPDKYIEDTLKQLSAYEQAH